MADKSRRKSSILKLPKTNQRAPLQDVNTLNEKKKIDDDEVTSHTFHQQRRVSFAGKNFVKEFCSEAEIVSVYHAREYEELLVSSDSSGHPSDYSHSRSNLAVTNNESDFQHTTVLTGAQCDDEYDPSLAIIRQFTGKVPTKPVSQPSGSVRKTRYSFGDIQVTSEDSQVSINGSQQSILVPKTSTFKETILTTQQNDIPTSNQSTEHQSRSDTVSHKITSSTKQPHEIQVTTSGMQHSIQTEGSRTISFQQTDSKQQSDEYSVLPSESKTNSQVPSVEFDQTKFDDSGMEFTKPISGVIEIGIPIAAGASTIYSPIMVQDLYSDSNNANCSNIAKVMNASTALGGAASDGTHINQVMTDNQENNLPVIPDSLVNDERLIPVNHCVSETNAISDAQCLNETMDFTEGLPSAIELNCVGINVASSSAELISHAGQVLSPNAILQTDVNQTQGSMLPKVADVLCDGTAHPEAIQTTVGLKESIKPTNGTLGSQLLHESDGVPPNDSQRIFSGTVQVNEPDVHNGVKTCSQTQSAGAHVESPKLTSESDKAEVKYDSNKFKSLDKTQILCTSMEFTKPVPGNFIIQMENKLDASSERIERENVVPSSKVISMCTSMEFTTAMPGNIEVGVQGFENEDGNEPVNKESNNKVLTVGTSMEFNRPVLSNIAVLSGDCGDIQQTEHVSLLGNDNSSSNKTQDCNISMEFTRPIPGNIEIEPDAFRIMESESSRSEAVPMCTSMELTKPLPSHIKVGFGECANASEHQKELGNVSCNKTQHLYTSMDLTTPLPANFALDVMDCEDLNAHNSDHPTRSQALCTSMEFTTPVPTNIELNFVECEDANGLVSQQVNEMSSSKTQPLCTSMELRKSALENEEIEIENYCDEDNNENEVMKIDFENDQIISEDINDADLLIIPSSRSPSPERSIYLTLPGLIPTPPGAKLLYATIEAASKTVEDRIKSMECPEPHNSSQLHASKRSFDEMECGSVRHTCDTSTSPRKRRSREVQCTQENALSPSSGEQNSKSNGENMHASACIEQSMNNKEETFLKSNSDQPDSQSQTAHSKYVIDNTPNASSVNHKALAPELSSSSMVIEEEQHFNLTDIIHEHEVKSAPQNWSACKEDNDIWLFKFECTCVELRVCLRPSVLPNNQVESRNGRFTSNISESTKPITKWGTHILMNKLKSSKWTSDLSHSTNFMLLLEQITDVVKEVKKFMFEMILQEGFNGVDISNESLTFSIRNWKCHLWFRVELNLLHSWESYLPEHISVKSIVGNVRETDIKNLITGVGKDIYFLRDYIRDIHDYLKVLED